MKKILMLVVALVGLSGCSTMGGLRKESLTAGTAREFTGTQTEVLKAAQEAVVAAGLNVEEVLSRPVRCLAYHEQEQSRPDRRR